MELKVYLSQYAAYFAVSFNRTFMELKAELATSTSLRLLFQSHLYGIESTNTVMDEVVRICFNRTFMELKVCVGTQRMPSMSFQS